MAYLAFGFDGIAGIATAPAARFTQTEWAVIRMAKRDRLGSIRAPSRIGSALRRLFGLGAANRLADPRLEALRQAAVRCWRGAAALDGAEAEGLLGHGFGFDQLALLAQAARPLAGLRG